MRDLPLKRLVTDLSSCLFFCCTFYCSVSQIFFYLWFRFQRLTGDGNKPDQTEKGKITQERLINTPDQQY